MTTIYTLSDPDGTARERRTISPAPGGGSQTFEVVRFSFAHDTPGLLVPASGPAGLLVTTLNPGDSIVSGYLAATQASLSGIVTYETWDGTTPQINFVLDPSPFYVRGNLPGTNPVPFEQDALGVANINSFDGGTAIYTVTQDSNTSAPSLGLGSNKFVFLAPVSIYAYLDDGSFGDPGSTAGSSELFLFVSRAV